jgi:predicted nuclease with TOPRIM domain
MTNTEQNTATAPDLTSITELTDRAAALASDMIAINDRLAALEHETSILNTAFQRTRGQRDEVLYWLSEIRKEQAEKESA